MSDLISRVLLSGLGLASLTKDAIQKTAKDLVDHSEISEAEGRKLVKDWQRRSAQVQKALDKRVHTAVHKAIKKLNAPKIKARLKGAKPVKKRARKSRRRGAAHKAGSR